MLQKILNNYKLFRILFWLWLLSLTILLLLPSGEIRKITFIYFMNVDKVAHAATMAFLSLLLILGTKKPENRIQNMSILILYSVIIEMVQAKISVTRSFEPADILANISGILFGYLLFLVLSKLPNIN